MAFRFRIGDNVWRTRALTSNHSNQPTIENSFSKSFSLFSDGFRHDNEPSKDSVDSFYYGFGQNASGMRERWWYVKSAWAHESRGTVHNGLGTFLDWILHLPDTVVYWRFWNYFQLGTSPLHMAAMNNHLDTCEVLLRAGISKDARTKVDRTPLHFAVYEGHDAIVEILLKYKCDVNARDMVRMRPMC